MRQFGWVRRWLLFIIVVAYLILGVAYSLIVPLGESPDEVDHARYVQYLVSERAYPVMAPVAADNVTMEANQPPLYYLLGAGIWGGLPGPIATGEGQEFVDFSFYPCFILDPDTPGRRQFYQHSLNEGFPYSGDLAALYRVRLLSLLLGAGTIALAYVLGRQLAPEDDRVGLLTAALVAFNPQFLFIGASVNNDNLTALLGAAIVVMSVAITRNPNLRRVSGLGLLLGLGALTKLALFALWPVALVAVAVPTRGIEKDWKAIGKYLVPRLALLFFLPLFVAGWWYIRSQGLYGDLLAWDVHLAAKGASILRDGAFSFGDLLDFISLHFRSYWANFGWLNIQPPASVFWIIAGLVIAAVVGLIMVVIDWLQSKRGSRTGRENKRSKIQMTPLLLHGLAIASVYLSLLQYIQTINWSGYQGRLAFAVAGPVAALLAVGLLRLLGPRLSALVGAGMALIAVGALMLVVSPAYARPLIYQPIKADGLTCARYAEWQLEGFSAMDNILPGEELPITLYGYAWEETEARLVLDIAGKDGEIVGHVESTVLWPAGVVHTTTLLLPVSESAQPARGLVRLGVSDGSDGWQGAIDGRGQMVETPLPLVGVKISPLNEIVEKPQFSTEAYFGDILTLTGYDMNQNGSQLTLSIFWQALNLIDQDYTMFVHVLDKNGQIISQWDAQPLSGNYPTSIWDVDEVVLDTAVLTIPSEPYQLAIGVYHPVTGERLPAYGPEGHRLVDDRFVLGDLH